MAGTDDILARMKEDPRNIRFSDLCKVCSHFFGEPRQSGSSHRIYKTPWQGDPRINIQSHWPLKGWRYIMALKNDRYTYRVTWSEDDKEYVGLCAEFPSLSWLATKPELALKGIRKLVEDVVKDLQNEGEPVPEPIACRQYSGKFIVRVPPQVHRKLAIQAAESGVSLNRLASSKLSQ